MQIIQSGPSSATLRQQALDQALGNVVQGYAAYDKQEKDKLLTLRQQALQDAELNLKLQAQGIDASAKDLMDYSQGNYKPKEISPALDIAEGLQGPVKPAVMGNANPLLNYTEAKKAQMLKEQQKLDLETDSKQADFKYKMAQVADLEAQSPLKAEKSQLELERLRDQISTDKQMSPIKKRSALLDIDKKMGEIANQPFQQNKIIAETQKAQYEASGANNTIPGFTNTSGIKPTDKDKETLKSMSATTKNIQASANNLINKLDKYGITLGAGLTKGDREVSQELTDLQLQMKELFNLGVLNGPDLDLINKALGNLQGPIDMLNPGNTRETAKEQVRTIINNAVKKLDNEATSRGFKVSDGFDESKALRLAELRAKAGK